ncbi:phage virion morphogenesis protein [Klebsiella pneumoniae]|uniref:phage virion morphogenesis protein n=1 Tax=Klebsiella pneumoniae complex TaxID=3390273 RepID=UPI000E2BAF07|nr:phage virion morphogenesis protein [Klebsiella pneumoniae]HBX9993541.1 phage virion morphogenesis protein [Klebsiella variicola]MBY8394988.1 phage virion morphogenesis protein [Klebsiella pneumoniae]MCM5787207.1 phage virion morphogenesis protein [Klebsiella pneumoniae]MEE2413156.1 phage virion morphogenesis protein [Klebsiella pneumoniae]SVM08588.1 phage tail completion protein [Klebsiella pneumoniae]
MNDFKPFEDKLAGLIAALSPAGRRRMTADIAKKLRQRQQQRIKSQKAPDGSPFAPRKRQPVRAKKGRIKREMFAKLRTNRFMKATGNDSAAVVEFTGKVQRITRVHQYGLSDKPTPNSVETKYIKRQLLGFNEDDGKIVEGIMINYLSDIK